MKIDDEVAREAQELAAELLDAGLFFVKNPGSGGTGFLGRNRGNKQGPRVTSVSDALGRRLQPKAEFMDTMRDMMLAQHERHQEERRKKDAALLKAKFFSSKSWLTLRYQVLSERGAECECCGASAKDGAKMQVDHIKPRSKYPELALEKSNLQVLCKACNMGKSNRHEDDWRAEKPKRILRKAA